MKLTVARNQLWRGIDTVLDAVASKPALPALSSILLEAKDRRLTLAATDLDLSIRTHVSSSVLEPGSIAVPARTFAEIAREWPEAELNIETQDERLLLSGPLGVEEGGEGAYALSGMSAEEFPEMPASLEGLSIELNAQGLTEMLNKTAFAVSRDETRPVLNGVKWQIDAQGLEMVATDGTRLSRYRQLIELEAQVGAKEPAEVIVPPQVCAHLIKLLGGERESVELVLGESQVFFDMGETQLLSRLIEGPYVNYEQVIPRQNDKRLCVTTQHLLPAVRRVSILSSSLTHQVRLKLSKDNIELSAASPEIGGEAHESIPASYEQEEMEVAYNANYLMEVLRKMAAEEVVFELSDGTTAALLRPAQQKEGEDYFCLLMPLRPSG